MADQYTWEKANQAGYKTTLQQLSRKTIADGALLNSYVIETFSGRDKYINDNLNKETASANSVFNTVKNNSATNWANSAIVGFSAYNVNTTKKVGLPNAAATFHVNAKYPNLMTVTPKKLGSVAVYNTMYFAINSAFGLSYHKYAHEIAQNNEYYHDFDDYSRTDSYERPSIVFGDNCTAYEHAFTMVNSEARNNGFAAFDSYARNGCVALINSYAYTNANMVGFALVDSTINNGGGSVTGTTVSFVNSNVDNAGLNIAGVNSYSNKYHSITLVNSTNRDEANGINLVYSNDAGSCSYGACKCSAVHGTSVAFQNCKSITGTSLAMNNVTSAHMLSFALNNVSGVTTCFAINGCTGAAGSMLMNNCGFCTAGNLLLNNCSGAGINNVCINNVHNVGTHNIMINSCSAVGYSAVTINDVYNVNGDSTNGGGLMINGVDNANGSMFINNVHNIGANGCIMMDNCASAGVNGRTLYTGKALYGNFIAKDVHNCYTTFATIDVHDTDCNFAALHVASAGNAALILRHSEPKDVTEFNWPDVEGRHNSNGQSVAMSYSIARGHSVALVSSYANNLSVALYNSTANTNSIAIYNSSAQALQIAMANNKLKYSLDTDKVNGVNIDVHVMLQRNIPATVDAFNSRVTHLFIV